MSQYDWGNHSYHLNSSDEKPMEEYYLKHPTSKHFKNILERTFEDNKEKLFLNFASMGVKLPKDFDVDQNRSHSQEGPARRS